MESSNKPDSRTASPWRVRVHEVIFEADTPAGKVFDILLLGLILLSIVAIMVETIPDLPEQYYDELHLFEWAVTLIFTAEYILRILSVAHPGRYIRSFYGIVDLLAILPTYVSALVAGIQYLMVIRVLRLLRIFRIFKLTRYVTESHVLMAAMRASGAKITVFLFSVLTIVVIVGSLMFLIEGEASGFTSIPMSMYWTIVTLTTVGYGDIAPITPLGRFLSCILMILGYGIIAVPTGIVTVELYQAAAAQPSLLHEAGVTVCPQCNKGGHTNDAIFCKHCGDSLGN